MFQRLFQRLSTGWKLAKQSIEVLKLDKELPLLGGLALLGAGQAVLGGILIALGIILILLASLITSALESIILAALYIYAAEGEQPKGFDSELVRTAFAPK